MFITFVALTAVCAMIGFAIRGRLNLRSRVGYAAVRLGLTHRQGTFFERDGLEGTFHDKPVQVRYITRSQGKSQVPYTRITTHGVAPGLALRREFVGGGFVRRITGAEDLATGDPAFDEEVVVSGDPTLVAANLDVDARAGARALLAQGAVVQDGQVDLHVRGHITEYDALEEYLTRSAELARGLGRLGELSERLRQLAVDDPIPGVRLHTLRLLMGRDAPAAAAAAAQLHHDFDPAVRVQATLLLRDDAELVAMPASDLRAFAPHDAEALARALMRANAEDALIDLLALERADVRIACARALARVGTVRCLPAIRALEGGFFANDSIKNAAHAAAAAIQARLGDLGAGAVSVASDGGEVSIADEAGRVAMIARQKARG